MKSQSCRKHSHKHSRKHSRKHPRKHSREYTLQYTLIHSGVFSCIPIIAPPMVRHLSWSPSLSNRSMSQELSVRGALRVLNEIERVQYASSPNRIPTSLRSVASLVVTSFAFSFRIKASTFVRHFLYSRKRWAMGCKTRDTVIAKHRLTVQPILCRRQENLSFLTSSYTCRSLLCCC